MNNLTPEILDQEGKDILFARVASKLLKDGEIDQATQICESGIKKFPDYAQGHFMLAKCYQKKDMNEEARTEYERVLRYDSSHLGALRKLASLFLAIDLKDVYKDYLYRLLTLDPLNSSVVEEAQQQGVYEQWKMGVREPFSQIEKIEPEEIGEEQKSQTEEEEKVEEKSEAKEELTDETTRIDLSQFENQDDDFNTIMDGLIQEATEDSEEVDALNYMRDLETPIEIESELLAEEKPLLDYDEEEMSSESDVEFEDKKSPFLEMDFSEGRKEAKEKADISELSEGDQKAADDVTENDDFSEEKISTSEEIEMAFKKGKEKAKSVDDDEFDLEKEFKPEIPKPEVDKIIEEKEEVPESTTLETTDITSDQVADQIQEMVPDKEEMFSDILEGDSEKSGELAESDAENGDNPYVKQKIVSQTLGEILVSQKKYKEARQVFEALKQQQPENQNINKKIEILDKIIDLENVNNDNTQ